MSKLIIGILNTVVAFGSLGLLIFVIKSLKGVDGGFGNLNFVSKLLAIFLTIASLTGIIAGGWFAVKSFTYKPAEKTEATEQLQAQIDKSKDTDKKYVQLIETGDYHTAGLSSLLDTYSDSGKTTIQNLSGGSEKTKAFILRTVGRNLKSNEGLFTTQLKTLSGDVLKLDDGKDHLLIFADDSEYSTTVLSLLYEKSTKNAADDPSKKLNYTIIFPTLDGTKIDQFFKANSSKIGTIGENSVVSIDSQPNQVNQSIYGIATQEYHVTDLPSYVAIDKTGVVSLAGVGTIIENSQKLNDWLNTAFYAKNKLYNEIERGVNKDEKGATTESNTAKTPSSSDSLGTQNNNSQSATPNTSNSGGN